MNNLDRKSLIGDVFNEIADCLEGSVKQNKIKIGLTLGLSELSDHVLINGAEAAMRMNPLLEIVFIGGKDDDACLQKDIHAEMETMLDNGDIHAAVTMHYNFPMGVTTVGRVITPATGKKMLISATTGSSSTHRVEALVRNAILGAAVAKASGIKNPAIGILNIEGARQAEILLKKLQENGYPILFSESGRADGSPVMRGNDLITGSPDVMVCDALTGNLLTKVFSAYTSGGGYETQGDGYGPSVGFGYDRIVCIVSRLSGSSVVAGALQFAAEMYVGSLLEHIREEEAFADKAGIRGMLFDKEKSNEVKNDADMVSIKKTITDHEITGIDILVLEEAVQLVLHSGIYATSGMGCTGPVLMVSSADAERVIGLLKKANYL